MSSASSSRSWNETAYEWLQRASRKRPPPSSAIPSNDTNSAAWAFVRGLRSSGIRFFDAVLKSHKDGLPWWIHLESSKRCGKTMTLLTVAANFLVATCANETPEGMLQNDTSECPRVIILDSSLDISALKLTHVIGSTLLRRLKSSGPGEQKQLELDLLSCMERTHMSTIDDISDWTAVLELIRGYVLETRQNIASSAIDPPTLLLWDGFLSEPQFEDETTRVAVVRQLDWLREDSSLFIVTTSSSSRCAGASFNKHISHRISLDVGEETSNFPEGPHYVATVDDSTQVLYSLSATGVCS